MKFGNTFTVTKIVKKIGWKEFINRMKEKTNDKNFDITDLKTAWGEYFPFILEIGSDLIIENYEICEDEIYCFLEKETKLTKDEVSELEHMEIFNILKESFKNGLPESILLGLKKTS